MLNVADFIRRSLQLPKIAVAVVGRLRDFRRLPRSAYKIPKCVVGFKVAILPGELRQATSERTTVRASEPNETID